MEQQSADLAVRILEDRRKTITDDYQRDLAELEKIISGVRAAAKLNGNGVGQNGWAGMTIADAIQAFLAPRDGPVPFEELMTALRASGVSLGKNTSPKRYAAKVKTTISNTPKRFKYNRAKDTVELVRPRA